MKGFVPTPAHVVDLMVSKLFRSHEPTADSAVLDPGCGEGEFIDGVLRWCQAAGQAVPRIVGIESHPGRARTARARFEGLPQVEIRHADFLRPLDERFTHIVGNPPYVPITALTVAERDAYRRAYLTARGRFDLYLLFYEQALKLLARDGRIVFITPEKFLYVDTAGPLRVLLGKHHVEELHFVGEDTFGKLVTYPLISTVTARPGRRSTRVFHRSGERLSVRLSGSGSWLPTIMSQGEVQSDVTLANICERVSCGVATGADPVFVVRDADLPPELASFAHPTIAGRQIAEDSPLRTRQSMLVPYDNEGRLLPEDELGALGKYLSVRSRHKRLMGRTCVARKRWYAFHETPPLPAIRRPKLLCKDVTATPFFVADHEGRIVPRHSTYYIVPRDPAQLNALADYLNSPAAGEWLRANCQRAANGFLRMQSRVLKRLPVPTKLAPAAIPTEQLPVAVETRPA